MSRRHRDRRCPYGFESCEECPRLRTNELLLTMFTLLLTGATGSSGQGGMDPKFVEGLLGKLFGVKQPGPAGPEAGKTGAEQPADKTT